MSPKAHYTAQMDEFIASRIAQAAESIATSEEQLAKNKAGTQELRPVEIPLLATANLLENTDGGTPTPSACFLGTAACYLLRMLTRAILMPALFQRQQLDELHDIKEMAEAGALSRGELITVITLAGGQMPA